MQNHSERIYLDHNATTPHLPLLKQRWSELYEVSGNPSSIHQDSRIPKTWLRETRQKLADYFNTSTLELIFNSGASEGNSSIFESVWHFNHATRPEFMISAVEHPSVVKTAEYLEKLGARIHRIPVLRSGKIDLDFIRKNLSERTALVSVMFANNETGTIFPIAEIAAMAHAAGALFHSDCVQMLGKFDLQSLPQKLKQFDLDYATFSAHKFYALTGTGIVYVKKNSPWVPLVHGGGQERSRRGGTENVLGIAALGIVMDEIKNSASKIQEMRRLRDLMEIRILKEISDCTVTAGLEARLSNTSSLVIKNVDGETLLMSLDLKGFSVSTGAACSSGHPEPSPVLLSMGLTRVEAQSSLRISLGWGTTQDQIEVFVETLKVVVSKLREIKFNTKDQVNAGI